MTLPGRNGVLLEEQGEHISALHNPHNYLLLEGIRQLFYEKRKI